MVDWSVPIMVGWPAPSAAWAVSSDLWPELCKEFVNRVLEGREKIEKEGEINGVGELLTKSGEPTVVMRGYEKERN